MQYSKNRLYMKRIAASLLAVCTIFLLTFNTYAQVSDTPPAYLKSVTYFSDAWVINFWNTESSNMEEELEQIVSDGFNSIILVIPWREFQPQVSPAVYNPYAFDKLDRIMDKAEEKGLWVRLRISYTWDFYDSEDARNRFAELVGDDAMRAAWLDYVSTVYKAASAHKNYCGGFITWEDFWNYVEDVTNIGQGSASVAEALRSGYQEYLKDNYTLDKVNEYYNLNTDFASYEEIYIPHKMSPAYRLFYEFYDDFLINLLHDGQQVYPNLSMEVRLDVDPVNGITGKQEGVNHFITFPCGSSSYTALMYSVSMGQTNNGEKIMAADALTAANTQLNIVKAYNGGKPVYIDQLLYMDATEGFSHNAQLQESEKPVFIAALPELLGKYTDGYGLWTYRNYTNNSVYNSQFALGDNNWEISRAKVVTHEGSSCMKMDNGGKISQTVGYRMSGQASHDNHVRFTADSDGPVSVTVKLGSISKQITVNGKEDYDLNFGKTVYNKVEFNTRGTVYLDNIDVYNFVQDGQLYDINNRELSCIQSFRELNAVVK